MNHDSGGGFGSGEGWMEEEAAKDNLTSAPRKLLSEAGGAQSNRWNQIVKADKCNQ